MPGIRDKIIINILTFLGLVYAMRQEMRAGKKLAREIDELNLLYDAEPIHVKQTSLCGRLTNYLTARISEQRGINYEMAALIDKHRVKQPAAKRARVEKVAHKKATKARTARAGSKR